jgi:hypothetical protein
MSRLLTCLAALPIVLSATTIDVAGQADAKRDVPTSIWNEPENPQRQDLFYGPWGAELAPDPKAVYTLIEHKHTGINPGMTVRDPQGREWSVKIPHPDNIDPEGPIEVTLSRLLSGAGYHQPPVYYLPTFTLQDGLGERTMHAARFRLKLDSLEEISGWKWTEGPFADSRPQRALLVLLILFNSTDLKPSNNSIYEYDTGKGIQRWYAARDLGAALGETRNFAPRKGHIEAFEQEPYILGVKNGYVEFAYRGMYRKLLANRITPDDVLWAHRRLTALSDRQWHDAFRAGGWPEPLAERFIARLREKMKEGDQAVTGRNVQTATQ